MTKFRRQKKRVEKADAILCADLHIRPDTPICRTDDFFAAMEKKIDFILALSEQHDCQVLVAGDFGHKPLNSGWPTWLLEWAINKFKGYHVIAILGQHDLPNHRLDLWKASGAGVLEAAGAIKVIGINDFTHTLSNSSAIELVPFPYGKEIRAIYQKENPGWPIIAMAHMMVIENKPLWPGQQAPKGHQLLKKFPEYNLILTGDNHNPFVAEYEGRILVNPGSMMRTTADQINHRPRVYLWWAKENKVEAVYLPIEPGKNVISREHIEVAKARSNRMDAFVERVKTDVEIKLSYTENMKRYFERYRTQKRVKEKTWEAVG